MEKPIAAASGIGWQGKHTNLVSREFGSWLFLGSIFTTLAIRARCGGRGSLRLVPRVSRHLSDARVSRALPDRCAALHFLSHDRAQGSHRARIPRGDRQSHLWLRRLSGGLPVEQVRANRARGRVPSAHRADAAAARGIGDARRCVVPRILPRLAGQAHRPRPVLEKRADRDRQFGRSRSWRAWPSSGSAMHRRWCARWRCGRCRSCCRDEEFAHSRSEHLPREAMRRRGGMAGIWTR